MRKFHRELRTRAVALGFTDVEFEPGSKHIMMAATHNGRRVRTVVASTPSDHRIQQNIISNLRRQVKA